MFEQVAASFGIKLILAGGCILAGFVIEDHLRARAPASSRAYSQNVRFNIAVTSVFFVAQVAMTLTGAGLLAAIASDLPGSGLIRFSLPDDPPWWAFALAVGVALAIGDLVYYWVHRAQHTWNWLWAIHELHHSDEHMNVTTTYRHHWAQVLFDTLTFGFVGVYLLAPPPAVAAPAVLIHYVVGHFVHMNARIRLRPIRWLLVSPQHHRIHHSSEPGHRDRNFAAFFPLWDIVFGTYYGAGRDEHPATGLIGGRPVTTVRAAVAWPWRRSAAPTPVQML